MQDMRGMVMKINFSLKWRRISALIVVLGFLSTLHFNCSKGGFQSAKHGIQTKDLSSTDPSLPGGDFSKPTGSPYALMTAHQVFSSMLNVTGQVGAVSVAMRAEFDLRKVLLSDNDSLTTYAAPLQISTTSLAGEVCNALITKEAALPMAERKIFQQVNFTQTLAQNPQAGFSASTEALAKSFWGRAPTSTEGTLLNEYYTDFVSSYDSTGVAATRKAYLSICSAMLSSFDAVTN
jgi:hypothetical protein